MSHPVPSEKRKPKCAQCHKHPVAAEYRPFCSKRCADVDLSKWLTGGYVVPGSATEAEDDSTGSAPSGGDAADD